MKIIKFISHPIVVSLSFFMILVSGDHFGGVYLLYLLLALPHAGLHSIMGLLAVAILAINFARQMSGPKTVLNPVLSIVGVFFMYGSLWYFFCQSWEETDNTFVQTVPLISLAVYVLCSLSLIINSVILIKVLSHQQGLRG